jgi:NAD-dependent deacetylase
MYDEEHFRFASSLKVAAETGLLLVVGTAGATNLPNQVAWEVHRRGGTILDVNIEENPFSKLALSGQGFFVKAPAASALPVITGKLKAGMEIRTQDPEPRTP